MISTDCRIESFLAAIEGKPPKEAILIADQEATEANRRLLRSRSKENDSAPCPQAYVESLKKFIGFVRYAVMKNRKSDNTDYDLFRSYLESSNLRRPSSSIDLSSGRFGDAASTGLALQTFQNGAGGIAEEGHPILNHKTEEDQRPCLRFSVSEIEHGDQGQMIGGGTGQSASVRSK